MKRMPKIILLIFFWSIALMFYAKTIYGGLVTDITGWFSAYETYGWSGIPVAFGDKALHHVYHFFLFICYKHFGFNGRPWTLSFTFLHALNAVLLFYLLKRILKSSEISSSVAIAFFSTLLFLLSPYQAEPVVWVVCIHYLLTTIFLLSALHSFFNYTESTKKFWIAAYYLFFIMGLFALEIALIFPLIVFFLIWLAPAKIFNGNSTWQLQKIFVAPVIAATIIYFLLNQWAFGSAVGHYGADTHLNFDLMLIVPNFIKYILKFLAFSQFFSHAWRAGIYTFIEQPLVVWLSFFLLVTLAVYLLKRWNSLRSEWKIAALFFLFFSIGLAPVINLFFSYILYNEGDRFSYFASLFFFPFLLLSLHALMPKWKYIFIAGYLFFSVKFLRFNTESFHNSGKIVRSLIEDFKWNDMQRIYILNIPDNFRGAYTYRSFGNSSSFAETLKLMQKADVVDKTVEILHYNVATPNDSVFVEIIDEATLKLTFAQWGNWFWKDGIGALSYKTSDYKVEIDEWGHSYNITFYKKPLDAVYLYEVRGKWKEVKGF